MKKIASILFWSVISAAFIGPGTVTTCIAAGAAYQTTLLWALVFATIACIILQEAAARIQIASGKSMGELIHQKFALQNRVGLILLFIAVALGCAAYEAGNILGAVAGLSLIIDVPNAWLTLAIVACAFVLLQLGNVKVIASVLGVIIALMGITFLWLATQLDINWTSTLINGLVPSIPAQSGVLIIGLIGTTIVPYNIFLGSGIGKGQSIQEMRFGLSIAILLGGLISIAILLVGTQLVGEVSFNAMADTIKRVSGDFTSLIFAVGLFGAGLTSAITAPFAAAITAKTLFGDKKWSFKSKNFQGVWIIVLVIGGVFGFTEVKPIPIIILAQALNGLLLPIITILLVLLLNDKRLLLSFTNHIIANVLILIVLFVSSFLGFLNLTKALYKVIGFEFHLNTSQYYVLTLLSLIVVGYTLFKLKK